MKKHVQVSEKEKGEIVNFYYNNPKMKLKDFPARFDISKRGLRKIFKERNIYTRRKNRYTLNDDYFDIINTEEKAYILGLIAADGFVGNNNNSFVFQSKDKELVEFIAKEINYNGIIRKVEKSGFNNKASHWVISFSSKKIRDDLSKVGIHYKKSLTFSKLPYIDEGLMHDFIRGYIDGDGSISISKNCYLCKKNNKVYTYYNCSLSVIGTFELLKEIIAFLDLSSYSIEESKTKGLFYLKIKSKKEIKKIAEKMYINCGFSLKRKRDKIIQYYNECL